MACDSDADMSRRDVLRAGVGATALAAAAGTVTAADAVGGKAGRKPRPNILFLIADQLRGDCLGVDGHPAVQTPCLDRIAKEGARFTAAYTAVPSCTPARAGLLTGLAPWHHGMLGYGQVAPKYKNEKPRMLREAGYHTLGIGKMHWHPQRNQHGFHKTILDESGRAEAKGFVSDYRQWFRKVAPELDPDATGIGWNDHRAKPYALPEHLHPTRWTGDEAVKFLEDYKGAEPFFLKVSFARPHSPYDPPERLFKMYEGAGIPRPHIGDWADRHAQRGKPYSDNLWQGDLGWEKVRRARQGYYGSVTLIDEQVGRIIKALEARGELDNTLIVFTADHGDMTGDHHLWRKTYAYDASARIPMLIRWGDSVLSAQRGQVLGQPVELRDILPTFLDAAGAPFDPARFDGRSMLDLIRGKTDGWRECIDFEHDVCYHASNHWNALCDGRWKYIFLAPTGEQQLFDLRNDPGELRDLAKDPKHKTLLGDWRGRMIAHLSERGKPFVVDGDLAVRPRRMLYSPNYPGRKRR